VLYSVRSERQLMEQVQYNLRFRWFIGLATDDVVWVPTVFTKNRERLIKHDAVIEFFNEVVAIAEKKDLLSGEHFSMDGTLIQAWAGHKSFVRRDGDDQDNDGGSAGDFKGSKRSNETDESRTDSDARLYRKGNTASGSRYMVHTLTDNRHGLVVNARVTCADGHAKREVAKIMINDARQAAEDANAEITLGADKGYDAQEFIEACQEMKVTPHVAQKAPVQIGGADRLSSGFDEREQAMSKLIDIERLFNGRHFDREVIVVCVRWYLRYKLSLRGLVEIMAERGLSLAHTTIMRWVKRFTPEFLKRWDRFAKSAVVHGESMRRM
jgi:IS5 family transposase